MQLVQNGWRSVRLFAVLNRDWLTSVGTTILSLVSAALLASVIFNS